MAQWNNRLIKENRKQSKVIIRISGRTFNHLNQQQFEFPIVRVIHQRLQQWLIYIRKSRIFSFYYWSFSQEILGRTLVGKLNPPMWYLISQVSGPIDSTIELQAYIYISVLCSGVYSLINNKSTKCVDDDDIPLFGSKDGNLISYQFTIINL